MKQNQYKHQGGICIALALFLFVSLGVGCASTHKTTKTETTVTTYPATDQEQKEYNNKGYITKQQDETIPERSETTTTTTRTTTTTETKAEHPGVISSTFHAIGYVIALPFIVIGGLFRIIFGG